MTYRKNRMGLTVQANPAAAATALVAAFKRAGGSTSAVAALYGASTCTVQRWIRVLDDAGLNVRDQVDRIREEGP
jgi:transposase